jgi:uncharacterized protein DUF4339
MGPEWYCLAFGIELGPMSWTDLRTRAARGDLGPTTKVRQGAKGQWIEAREVEALLSARSENNTNPKHDTDFEVSAAFVTAKPDDADFISTVPFVSAKQTTVADPEGDQAPDNAGFTSTVPLVLGERSAATHGEAQPAPDDADFATSAPLVPREETAGADGDGDEAQDDAEFTLSVPASIGEQVVEEAQTLAAGESETPQANSLGTSDSNSAPTDDGAACAESATTIGQAPDAAQSVASPPGEQKAVAAKEPPRKASRKPPKAPRAPLELHISPRVWQALGIILLLTMLGGVGRWLWSLDRRDPSEYVRIASGFQQIFDELHQFRDSPKKRGSTNISVQLMPRVASLRKELLDARPGSVGGTLSEAGSRLAELLSSASIGRGSPAEGKYAETEKQFVTLIGQAKRELGQ